MTKAIKTALIGILSLGLLACQGKPSEKSIELLPEILLSDIKRSQVEITEFALDEDPKPEHFVINPAGTYVYAKPNTSALKIKTYFSGDIFWAEKVDDTWLRVVTSLKIEGDWVFVAGYVKQEDVSIKWQDVTLNQSLMNQASAFFYDSISEPVYPPNDRRFAELSQYARIELIDKETYEAASRERVEQFVIDTLTHRKQRGRISIPTKQGDFVLQDEGEQYGKLTLPRQQGNIKFNDGQEEELNEEHFYLAKHEYIGRVAPNGSHIALLHNYDDTVYMLINPEADKQDSLTTIYGGFPLLSPKGDYLISIAEDSIDGIVELAIHKALSNNNYVAYAYIYPTFWLPYTHLDEPMISKKDYTLSTKDFLPKGNQFWSRDNYFYLRIRPAAWRYKDLTERDPREYYTRIKILDKPTGKPKLGK